MKDLPARTLKTRAKDTAPTAAGPSARTPPSPPRTRAAPTIRLCSIATMDAADQQRLELLLDRLVERRLSQVLDQETT
jgi:hypothetical protein